MPQTAEQALDGSWREEDRGFDTPCWIWQKSTQASGYGQTFVDGKFSYAHRAAFELWKRKLRKGEQVHHRCSVRCCVNPEHMEAVDIRDHAGAGGHGKLTSDDAAQIRALDLPDSEIARRYGVSRSLVSMIQSGRRWATTP